jgi:hypothetical protein
MMKQIGMGPGNRPVFKAVDGGYYGVLDIRGRGMDIVSPELLIFLRQMKDAGLKRVVLSFEEYAEGRCDKAVVNCEALETTTTEILKEALIEAEAELVAVPYGGMDALVEVDGHHWSSPPTKAQMRERATDILRKSLPEIFEMAWRIKGRG